MHVLAPSNLKLQRTVNDVGSLGVGAALAPDGDTVFINDENGAILRVSISEGTVERPDVSGSVVAIAFASDDSIVALHQFGSVMKATISTGEIQCRRWPCGWQASLSPKGKRAALSSKSHDGSTSILDIEASKIVATCRLDGAIAVNDDGLVCASTERGVLLGDGSTRVEAPSLRRFSAVAFGYDGGTIFGRSNSDLTRIAVKDRAVRDVAKVSRGMGVASDGSGRVVVGAGPKIILLGDEATKSGAETFAFKNTSIVAVASTVDGSVVAGADSRGSLLLARRGDPRSSIVVRASLSSLSAVAFSPDGAMVAVGGSDCELLVYSVQALFDAHASTKEKKAKPADKKPAAKEPAEKKPAAKKGKAKK